MTKPGRKPHKVAETFMVPAEHVQFMRDRIRFLMHPSTNPEKRRLEDLLANAYQQGMEDCFNTLLARGKINWPELTGQATTPAQQDNWP